MDITSMLAKGFTSWYYVLTFIGLIGVIIFYGMYRKNQQ